MNRRKFLKAIGAVSLASVIPYKLFADELVEAADVVWDQQRIPEFAIVDVITDIGTFHHRLPVTWENPFKAVTTETIVFEADRDMVIKQIFVTMFDTKISVYSGYQPIQHGCSCTVQWNDSVISIG